MSYQNYKEAMKIAPKCRFYTTAGGKTQEEISKSEELLSVNSPNSAENFMNNTGICLSLGMRFLVLTRMILPANWNAIPLHMP